MTETIEQIRDRTLAEAMRQLEETHAVLRVTACWSSAERDLGLIGIDTFEPHVDLERHLDREDIIIAMTHGIVRQHMDEYGRLQSLWSLTDKGIDSIRRQIEFAKEIEDLDREERLQALAESLGAVPRYYISSRLADEA